MAPSEVAAQRFLPTCGLRWGALGLPRVRLLVKGGGDCALCSLDSPGYWHSQGETSSESGINMGSYKLSTNVHTEAVLKINSGQIPEMGWGGTVLLLCQIPAEPKCQGNITESTAGS